MRLAAHEDPCFVPALRDCRLRGSKTGATEPPYHSGVSQGPYFTAFPNLAEALQTNTAIRTSARACTILPNFVGLKLLVHNGKEYIPVNITPQMVGHKLGEFSPTRKRFSYKASKNR
ncbi:mitochondrial ribosomal small subunit component [Puccinia graminis f. sp. tritici]|uniref:Mitochondrial ribosomal small subunit component n=1 Tax=Puccinia graminis f. sp. tritici TaxID=56615 RepID=A0A5B0N7Z6_PUCGR|nr:mitochondrial ribosomal small subunit component [Puccinia graminis f. sp. tritici]KAA1118391.1 mitochondrial ribosomal small subunit component [Puccinia graminis f. sp. tritici]